MDLNKYQLKYKFHRRYLLSLKDLNDEEIAELICLAREYKYKRVVQEQSSVLKNKYVLLITKPRFPQTGITFEIAVKELGGIPVVSAMNGEDIENRLADEYYVKALSTVGLSAIMVSTSKVSDTEMFEKTVNLPVINATNDCSPCQALSALLTIFEICQSFSGLKVTLVGNFKTEDNSLLYGLIKLGADVTLFPTKNGDPTKETIEYCSQYTDLKIVKDKAVALKGAEIVCIGSSENDESLNLNSDDLLVASPVVKVLTPVPVDYKIADKSVFKKDETPILKQAENLIHVYKSVLTSLAGKKI
ncbi:MAG: hypothetical protein J6R88_02695 [Clostridia bacterium]|nr:hypothetical protein [Clostridia bacterium]